VARLTHVNSGVDRYEVEGGDRASPLDYAKSTSLCLGAEDAIVTATERPILSASLVLPPPGSLTGLANTSWIVIDTSPPLVQRVFSLTPDGAYGVGNHISILVEFDQPIIVMGAPRIALNTIPITRYGEYLTGSGTKVLEFVYEVEFPDESSRLDIQGPTALAVNGGAILRQASGKPSTDADLSLANFSLAASSNITIAYQAAARVVEVTSPLPNGTYAPGQEVPIWIRFTTTVNLVGEAYLLLATGNRFANLSTATNMSIAAYERGSGTSRLAFKYTVRFGDNVSALNCEGAHALVLMANTTLRDTFGNDVDETLYPGALDLRALNYTRRIALNSDPPYAIRVASKTPDGTYGIGQELVFEVLFSAPVAVVGVPRLNLQTFYRRPDAQAVYRNGSGTDRLTFSYITADQDWAQGLPAARSQLVDYDGVGALVLGALSSNASIYRSSTHPELAASLWLPKQDQSALLKQYELRVDPNPPRVLNVTCSHSGGTYGAGEEILIFAEFNAPVVVSGEATLLLNTSLEHASRTYAQYLSGNGTAVVTFVYTVRAGDSTVRYLDYVDTRLLPYDVAVPASSALIVKDYALSARYPNYAIDKDMAVYKRFSSFPTTAANLMLPIPGRRGSLSSSAQIGIDTRPPYVLSVSTTIPDGTYGVGEEIPLIVQFSTPVVLSQGAIPVLELNTGMDHRLATFVSGNGTDRLFFLYVVAAGDRTPRLDYARENSFWLRQSALWVTEGDDVTYIRRLSTHPLTDVNMTLPPPGYARRVTGPKSLVGNRHSLCIDTGGLYVVNVTTSASDGCYGAGEEIFIHLAFTEEVYVTGSPVLMLNVQVGFRAGYLSGSGTRLLTFLYRVRYGDLVPRLGCDSRRALVWEGATMTGADTGVAAVVTLPPPGTQGSLEVTSAIQIDTSSPIAVNVTGGMDGRYGVGDLVRLYITFSYDIVLHEGTPELLLRLADNSFARARCGQSSPRSLLCLYWVLPGHASARLEYYDEQSLVLGYGVVLRASTNPLTGINCRLPCPRTPGSLSASSSIHIDTSPPRVTAVTSAVRNGTYGAKDQLELLVHFTWAVRVTGYPRLLLNSGGDAARGPAEAIYRSGSGTDTLRFVYVVDPDHASSDLDYLSTDSLILGPEDSIDKASGMRRQAAVLELPRRGSPTSLGWQADLMIDSSAPRVIRVYTSLEDGIYGPGVNMRLLVQFSRVVLLGAKALPGPLLELKVGNITVAARFAGLVNNVTFSFNLTFKESWPAGSLSCNGLYALQCPQRGQADCIVSPRYEKANLVLPSRSGKICKLINGTATDTPSDVLFEPSIPLVERVFCASPLTEYGFSAGDRISIGIAFTAPIAPPRVSLGLALNLQPSSVANFSRIQGKTLFFSYEIKSGDCTEALDYLGPEALRGTVHRIGSEGSPVTAVLPQPGTRGSISFSQKIPVACQQPYVLGLFPIKLAGTYVEGDLIIIVVRFSQPVTVVGKPRLRLATGRNYSYASFYPDRALSGDVNFNALPTDLFFIYEVEGGTDILQLTHRDKVSFDVRNATVFRASQGPSIPAVTLLAPPDFHDSLTGNVDGRWWGDYARRVEVLLRDLTHPDARDLRVLLTHGNQSATVIPGSPMLSGKRFGRSASSDGLGQAGAVGTGGDDSVSYGDGDTSDGIGYDYAFSDVLDQNIAPHAVATQSSTLFGGVAPRANDGNVDGRFSKGSVIHTGFRAGAEVQPWWQLMFTKDELIGAVRLWNRVREFSLNEIQTISVTGPVRPKGFFRLRIRTSDTNETFTTTPISTEAVAMVRDENPRSVAWGSGKGESVQAKLEDLGVIGTVSVQRTQSDDQHGFTWTVTFVTGTVRLKPLEPVVEHLTTRGAKLYSRVVREGVKGDLYNERHIGSRAFQARLFPCWVMVLPQDSHPETLGNLTAALESAIWKHRLEEDRLLTTLNLPAGVRGKYLRIQLEGSGYLSFAELQVS
jgi:hypothetical protein